MILKTGVTLLKQTINRLLKKQVSRRSNRDKAAAEESEPEADEEETRGGPAEKKIVDPKQVRRDLKQMPAPFFRYIQSTQGSSLSLPMEQKSGATPYARTWDAMFSTSSPAKREQATM